MNLLTLQVLFLIPVGVALAFLLWVFWSVTQELSGQPSTEKQPMISIQVGDRHSTRKLLARARPAPELVKNLQPGTGQFSQPAPQAISTPNRPTAQRRISA